MVEMTKQNLEPGCGAVIDMGNGVTIHLSSNAEEAKKARDKLVEIMIRVSE